MEAVKPSAPIAPDKFIDDLAVFEAELEALATETVSIDDEGNNGKDEIQPVKMINEQQQKPQQQQQQVVMGGKALLTQLTTPSTNPTATPCGRNRNLREFTRILLAVTALALFSDCNGIATLCSAGAIFMMKSGTLMSTKNLRWGALAIMSFMISLVTYCLGYSAEYLISSRNRHHEHHHHHEHDHVDHDSPSLGEGIFIGWMKFVQVFWASLLTFILFVTYLTKGQEYDKTIQNLTPVKID
jgi:hypothetical protein